MEQKLLTEKESRVLGCLIEKEFTTPEYYPMTLNSITNACNQKNNRFPLVTYEETQVQDILNKLKEKRLLITVQGGTNRVLKFKHDFSKEYNLTPVETAVMAELMLRGPQTGGEIRSRAARMQPFDSLDQVLEILQGLSTKAPPLVILLPRQPGMRENRYAHLLNGAPVLPESAPEEPSLEEKVVALETEVNTLRQSFESLKAEFTAFKSQF